MCGGWNISFPKEIAPGWDGAGWDGMGWSPALYELGASSCPYHFVLRYLC